MKLTIATCSFIAVALAALGCRSEPDATTRCTVRVNQDMAAYTEQVRTMELGFRSSGEDGSGGLTSVPNEAAMVTGDQNILNVRAVVRYRVRNVEAFTSRVDDPEGCPDGRTLRDATLAALNEAVGQHGRDALLTPSDAWLDVEATVRSKAQTLLDDYRTGIEVLSVDLQDVSLPPQVCATRDAPGPAAVEQALAQSNSVDSARLLLVGLPPISAFTSDKRNLLLDAYVRYRIVDERAFNQALGSEQTAASRITDIVTAELRAEISALTAREVIGGDIVPGTAGSPYTVRPAMTAEGIASREAAVGTVRQKSNAKVKANGLGISVVDVRIRTVSFPVDVRESVYSRMRADPSVMTSCPNRDA
jgi:regulator of protease activity HflC (stomatin/prohibitin superfamily)